MHARFLRNRTAFETQLREINWRARNIFQFSQQSTNIFLLGILLFAASRDERYFGTEKGRKFARGAVKNNYKETGFSRDVHYFGRAVTRKIEARQCARLAESTLRFQSRKPGKARKERRMEQFSEKSPLFDLGVLHNPAKISK